MLHFVPVRALLTVVSTLAGLAILAAVYGGIIGTGDALHDAFAIIRWSGGLAVALIFLMFATWRWIPAVQRMTFPYLGGEWRGELHFTREGGEGSRKIHLDISHTAVGLKLILDSDESTSRTLVVHAEHDRGINCHRLYYVFLNERKEGLPGGGNRYRGLAVMRVELGKRSKLHGEYFTEHRSKGTLFLQRNLMHPWWALWK